ncbi:LuxR C-terminal-related transcriptional regulator [Hominifimenecus sp. rT4P-3]|uniref:helix-turn-helix transcriptional regulator n=1 Tax=Hominifimenecus sp. rT4P-3 TaxID=3242979 RepID=UPI003DA44DC7
MSNILTKITQNVDFKKKDRIPYINAVILMGLFTFLFLGAEYLYVDVLSRMVSEDKTVLAQNYALGVSAAGFLLYPLFHRFCKKRLKIIISAVISLASILCIALICTGTAYTMTFIMGLVLFLLLGLFGSAAFYVSMRMMKTDRYLARTVGISYALGILLQFANNNLVRSEIAQAIILSVFLMLLVCMLIKNDRIYCEKDEPSADPTASDEKTKDDAEKTKKGAIVGILMVLLVVLMTFIFSTLDNAVTLAHANGTMDIGQWPRILLTLSGLTAGFVFDIKNRKYMGLIMYCIMILSTICIVVLKFAGPFLVGLIVFYLSAGFFAVFFTSGFMELARHMRTPALWAGMGRAINNITAAVIASLVLTLLSTESSIAVIVLVLFLFAAVSIVAAAYTFQKKIFMEQLITDAADAITEKEKLRKFSEVFSFTEREAEVFNCLVNTEDNVQTIAESLYVSRRTLERYISAIYEKTGVKSRVGLLNLYNK